MVPAAASALWNQLQDYQHRRRLADSHHFDQPRQCYFSRELVCLRSDLELRDEWLGGVGFALYAARPTRVPGSAQFFFSRLADFGGPRYDYAHVVLDRDNELIH